MTYKCATILVLLLFPPLAPASDNPVIIVGKIPQKMVVSNHGPVLEYVTLGPTQEQLARWGNPWKAEISYTGTKTPSLRVASEKALGVRVTGARHAVPQYPGGRWNGSRSPVTRPKVRFDLPYRNRDN